MGNLTCGLTLWAMYHMNNKGFTLIETLVATFIFSIVAIAYIQYLNTSVRSANTLLSKKHATLIADNVMVQKKLCIKIKPVGTVEIDGNKYLYEITALPHEKLQRKQWVKISIFDNLDDDKKRLVGVLAHMNSTNECKGL